SDQRTPKQQRLYGFSLQQFSLYQQAFLLQDTRTGYQEARDSFTIT
ncbi:15534_t:CDS:1, partial [Rhizophagus irregularis]